MSKAIHVYPKGDTLPHITDGYPQRVCPCKPAVEWEGTTPIVIHNSYDARERAEKPQEAA